MATPILRAAPLFAALADPTRLAILERLRRGERCVSELCADVPASQSLISFHLKALRDAGIVFARKDGRTVWYAIDPSGLARLERLVQLLKDAGDHVDQRFQAADLEMCMGYISSS
jgi:ArsR family transcriptional regulator, arsenate/arsenite/antimonite-responsive transcriptional repressor